MCKQRDLPPSPSNPPILVLFSRGHFSFSSRDISQWNLKLGSCLTCVYRVMDSRGKFGEHERDLIVALGGTTRNSSFSDNNNNNNRKGSQEIIIASSLSSGHRSLIAGARSDMTVMPKVSIFIKKLRYHHVLPHKIKRASSAKTYLK